MTSPSGMPALADSLQGLSDRQMLQRRRLSRAYGESGELDRIEQLRNSHAGERCFVIAGGPSLLTQDLSLIGDTPAFGTDWVVRHPALDRWKPTYYCGAGHELFGGWGNPEPRLDAELATLLGERTGGVTKFFPFRFRSLLHAESLFPLSEVRFLLFDDPRLRVEERGTMNLDPAQPLDDAHDTVTTFALVLARLMGFGEIVLLGCDGAGDDAPLLQSYRVVKSEMETEGIRLLDATAGGGPGVFERAVFEELVA